jgi:hypothetical protein
MVGRIACLLLLLALLFAQPSLDTQGLFACRACGGVTGGGGREIGVGRGDGGPCANTAALVRRRRITQAAIAWAVPAGAAPSPQTSRHRW